MRRNVAGPGASSLYGLFGELGPLQLDSDSLLVDPPALFYNPEGWQSQANLLAIEQPPPTGFSFCGDAVAGDMTSCGNWTDEDAALENYKFLLGPRGLCLLLVAGRLREMTAAQRRS